MENSEIKRRSWMDIRLLTEERPYFCGAMDEKSAVEDESSPVIFSDLVTNITQYDLLVYHQALPMGVRVVPMAEWDSESNLIIFTPIKQR